MARSSGLNADVVAAKTDAVPATSTQMPARVAPQERKLAAVSPQPATTGTPGSSPHSPAMDGESDPDHLVRRDDARQLPGVHAEAPAEIRIPHARARVGEAREVEVARVDERGGAVHGAEAHGRVAAGLHEAPDPRPRVGPLVLPPEDLGPVVEARRAAGLPHDLGARLALHALDVRGAPGVQPGVVGRDGPAVVADADDARHLAVDGDAGDRARRAPWPAPCRRRFSPRTRRWSRRPIAPGARGPPRPRRARGA